ncbi:hypothetical protein F4808DRAFT_466255 [Astrocystis sublimbata]|nr:hypothetical protein F4808DRAFT_466255 [Astrocystis sublimbata]
MPKARSSKAPPPRRSRRLLTRNNKREEEVTRRRREDGGKKELARSKDAEEEEEEEEEEDEIISSTIRASPPDIEWPFLADPLWRQNDPHKSALAGIYLRATPEEKESVRDVLRLMNQAHRAIKIHEPPALDVKGDIVWDWAPRHLTSTAYGKLVLALERHSTLHSIEDGVYWDWIPDNPGAVAGTFIVRNAHAFQHKFDGYLTEILTEALRAPLKAVGIEHPGNVFQCQTKASVLVNGAVGVRTPCRVFHRRWPDDAPDDRDDKYTPSFVIEVGMARKSKELPALARSYVERGTRAVLTADIRRGRGDRYDYHVAYTVYRQGRERAAGDDDDGNNTTAGGVPTRLSYEVVLATPTFVPELLSDEDRKSAGLGLTLFDLFPAGYLAEHGLTDPDDPRAALEVMGRDLVGAAEPVEWFGSPFPCAISEQIKELDWWMDR